jgi:hypothetical protein
MEGENAERWRQLCEQAAIEQDPLKLIRLVTEINRLLLEKEERLLGQKGDQKARQAEASGCDFCQLPLSPVLV